MNKIKKKIQAISSVSWFYKVAKIQNKKLDWKKEKKRRKVKGEKLSKKTI